jgi:hypothetical protein
MSRFQIRRVDDPTLADQHYRAFWAIEGKTFRVHIWSLAQWRQILWANRPRDACVVEGPGRMTLRPIDEPEATPGRAEGRDRPAECTRLANVRCSDGTS